PQTAHFAVATFHHHAVIPVVEAFAAGGFLNVGEFGRAVFQHHTGFQQLDHFLGHFTPDTDGIFAIHLVGRVHQAVGQLTVGGEHQQPSGVDVETADVDPAAFFGPWQTIKHGR